MIVSINMGDKMEYKRKWIDVLKGLLVIVIYIGCVSSGQGIMYSFVSTHSAALFFCVLGVVDSLDKEEKFVKYTIQKVKTVLVPCFVLAYLVLVISTIQYDLKLDFVKVTNATIVKGLVRNTFAADSLWLLTCLFSIQLLFFAIKKVRRKWLIFAICLGVHCYNVMWLNSIEFPRWYFNMDSALYYVLFYASGYLAFPYVEKLFELDTRKKKIVFVITSGISLIYSAGLYFGLDLLSYAMPLSIWRFTPSIRAYIIIWLYFVGARMLQKVKSLSDIGKNVLILCGSEYILRTLIATVVSVMGLSFAVNYPIDILMYTGIAIFIGNRYWVPVGRYLTGKVVREV